MNDIMYIVLWNCTRIVFFILESTIAFLRSFERLNFKVFAFHLALYAFRLFFKGCPRMYTTKDHSFEKNVKVTKYCLLNQNILGYDKKKLELSVSRGREMINKRLRENIFFYNRYS